MRLASHGLIVAAILGWSASLAAPIRQGVDAAISFRPLVWNTDSDRRLRYELRLTNFARDPLVVDEVQIIDRRTGTRLATLSEKTLADGFGMTGSWDSQNVQLPPGREAWLYIDIQLPAASAPREIEHRFTFSDDSSSFVVHGARGALPPHADADFGPPLKGGPWAAVYDPSAQRGHRRVVYAVAGKATIPGRFAIDWFKVDQTGKEVSGQGEPVLAVASGVIAAVSNEFADPDLQSPPPGPDLRNDAGNYIVLALADHRYVFYEHLQHGIRVKPGQKVRRGQVIAALGATGHVTGPHLHFHVGSTSDPLNSEGLPFGFQQFEILSPRSSGKPGSPLHTGMPTPNAIIRFPG